MCTSPLLAYLIWASIVFPGPELMTNFRSGTLVFHAATGARILSVGNQDSVGSVKRAKRMNSVTDGIVEKQFFTRTAPLDRHSRVTIIVTGRALRAALKRARHRRTAT